MIYNVMLQRSSMLLVSFIFGFTLVFAGVLGARDLPKNVEMMTDVWEAYEDRDWEHAIDKANELIDEFEADASEKQKELTTNNVPEPPNGKVTETEKSKIFALGPLHEVAAAWWVKGSSLEKRQKQDEALESYQRAANYTHARVYDPSWDGFWAPGKKAKQRIDRFQSRN